MAYLGFAITMGIILVSHLEFSTRAILTEKAYFFKVGITLERYLEEPQSPAGQRRLQKFIGKSEKME